jgi:hypothetical protein
MTIMMVNSSPQTCIIYFLLPKGHHWGKDLEKCTPNLPFSHGCELLDCPPDLGLSEKYGTPKIWCFSVRVVQSWGDIITRDTCIDTLFSDAHSSVFPFLTYDEVSKAEFVQNHLEKNSWSASCRSSRSCLQQTHFGEVDAGREGLRRLRFTCNVDHVGGLRVGARFSELKPKNGAENFN